MLSRRTLLQTVPLLAAPLPVLASQDPLAGLQPPNIVGVKFSEELGDTRLEFFWNSPEEPRYLMFSLNSPKLLPQQTREDMLRYGTEYATLQREDLRVYHQIMGFSALDSYSHGLSFQFLEYSKEHGQWTPRLCFGQKYKSKVLTREEWVEALKTNYIGEAGKGWAKDVTSRLGFSSV